MTARARARLARVSRLGVALALGIVAACGGEPTEATPERAETERAEPTEVRREGPSTEAGRIGTIRGRIVLAEGASLTSAEVVDDFEHGPSVERASGSSRLHAPSARAPAARTQ